MVEGFLESQQVGGAPSTKIEMVPAPPQGERDRGSPKDVEVETTTVGPDKDKGKALFNAHTNAKDAEGCSGTRKEEVINQGTRRTGQCVPKSNTIP